MSILTCPLFFCLHIYSLWYILNRFQLLGTAPSSFFFSFLGFHRVKAQCLPTSLTHVLIYWRLVFNLRSTSKRFIRPLLFRFEHENGLKNYPIVKKRKPDLFALLRAQLLPFLRSLWLSSYPGAHRSFISALFSFWDVCRETFFTTHMPVLPCERRRGWRSVLCCLKMFTFCDTLNLSLRKFEDEPDDDRWTHRLERGCLCSSNVWCSTCAYSVPCVW